MTPTNRRFLLEVFAVLVVLHASGLSDAAAELSDTDTSSSLRWTLYHAIAASDQEPVFEKRGSIALTASQESSTAVLEVENVDLSSSSRAVANQLLDVAGTPKMYQLKLVSDNDSSIQPILTTVSACQVLRAQFRDEFILSFDQNANVVSMTYVPLVSPLAPKSCQDLQDMMPTNVVFDSKISFELATPGMTLQTTLPLASKPPPGLKFFAKPKANGNTPGGGGGPGAEPEPMTGPIDFFKRYWYVIVPLLLMNLFGGQAPEEEDKSAGAGGAARPPVANAAAGAAAATAVGAAGTPSPKRRGKRG